MAYLPIQAHSTALSINIIQLHAIIQRCHSFSKLLAFIYIILFPKSLISSLLSLNYLLTFGFCIYLLGKPEQLNSSTHLINSHVTLWFVHIYILSYLLQFWLLSLCCLDLFWNLSLEFQPILAYNTEITKDVVDILDFVQQRSTLKWE